MAQVEASGTAEARPATPPRRIWRVSAICEVEVIWTFLIDSPPVVVRLKKFWPLLPRSRVWLNTVPS